MKPRLHLPIALLTGACATRPWTPAMSASFSSEPVSQSVEVRFPARLDMMLRWLLPREEAWAPWTKATLLSAVDEDPPLAPDSLPDVRTLNVVSRAEAAARVLAREGIPQGSLWVTDLRGAASVAFASVLSNYAPVAPVLTFNNWPAEDEVIPAEETLAALLLFSPRLPLPNVPATPVFMLDSWRLAYTDEYFDEATDNRYALTPADFPTAEQLLARGITRVVYVVEEWDQGDVEEDDLHEVFMEWAEAAIAISVVDLRTLNGEPRIDAYLANNRYYPSPRSTIIDGDWLPAHSPGGFGGYAGPPRTVGGLGRGFWMGGGG
jgi:hypothetical protein